MHALRTGWIVLLVVFTLVASGCGRNKVAPPTALAPEQVAPTLDTAFKDAAPEARTEVDDTVAAIKNQETPKAYLQLEALNQRPDLTADQSAATARAMVAMRIQLQKAAANGDSAAADILEKYRKSK